jgi:excisionase family DNA binding protein
MPVAFEMSQQYNFDFMDDCPEVLVVSPFRAARLLGISRTTLYQMIYRGELESFTLGKGRRITLRSIHALIERRVAVPDEKLKKRPSSTGAI